MELDKICDVICVMGQEGVLCYMIRCDHFLHSLPQLLSYTAPFCSAVLQRQVFMLSVLCVALISGCPYA